LHDILAPFFETQSSDCIILF